MEDQDRKELAVAIAELYKVVDSLISTLEKELGNGQAVGSMFTPIGKVASKMSAAKRKATDDLRRLTGNPHLRL